MAVYEFTRTAPFGAIAIHNAVTAVQSVFEALGTWNEMRRTRAVLSSLSNDVLRDIGIERSDIERF